MRHTNTMISAESQNALWFTGIGSVTLKGKSAFTAIQILLCSVGAFPMMSQTLNFVVLHDCLEDAAYALETGQADQAVAYLESARSRLRELVADLVIARSQIAELEGLLNRTISEVV